MSEPNTEVDTELDPFSLEDDADDNSDGDTTDEHEDTEEEAAADVAEKANFEAVQKERAEETRIAAATRAEEERAGRAAAARAERTRPTPPVREPAPAPAPAKRIEMLARVKPFNAKKGQTMRTHSFNHNGTRVKFVEGHGWYEVDHVLAERLRNVRCSDMDPESNLAFDVCSAVEARKIDAREEEALEQETRSPARRPRSAVN